MASKRTSSTEINFWAAVRDVLVHAMDKGQLPLTCAAGVVALAIIKLPAAEVSGLLHRVLDNLTTLRGVSYVLNGGLVIAWYSHARWQRRSISVEMDRMGREKTQLQEKHTGRKLASDNPKTNRGDE